MKRIQKVLAAILAVVIVASMASCVPVSLTKQWCYKYGDTQYDIGVYIYSLYTAYSNAESYAKDAKGYKEGESFLDLKIKADDEEKTTVARDWILTKAKEQATQLVAVDKLIKDNKVKVDSEQLKAGEESAKNDWDMGPYASVYSSYDPISKKVEPYGVSFESFSKIYISPMGSSTPYTLKNSALFDALYDEGGSKAVSDKDLEEYFLKNYTDYSYIPVKLYDSTTDDDGNSTNKAFSEKKTKTIKEFLNGFVDEINKGTSDFEAVAKKCKKKYSVTDDEVQTNRVDLLDTLESQDKDVYKAITKLKNGKATMIIKDEDSDTATAYIVVKNDISKDKKDYVSGDQRKSVLQNMKSEEYKDYVNKQAKELDKDKKFEANTGVIDSYSPEMFYEKPEETSSTAAEEADS